MCKDMRGSRHMTASSSHSCHVSHASHVSPGIRALTERPAACCAACSQGLATHRQHTRKHKRRMAGCCGLRSAAEILGVGGHSREVTSLPFPSSLHMLAQPHTLSLPSSDQAPLFCPSFPAAHPACHQCPTALHQAVRGAEPVTQGCPRLLITRLLAPLSSI